MNLVARTVYRATAQLARVYQRLFMDLQVWGQEHIPAGPKIYISNHITDLDWLLMAVLPDALHMVVGPAYANPLLARMLDAFEQINAMPEHRKNVVRESVRYLNRGDSVLIFPEGDAHAAFKLGQFYPGVARVYRDSQVPMIPVALAAPQSRIRKLPFTTNVDGRIYRSRVVLRGPLRINIGKPLKPPLPAGSREQQDQFIADLARTRVSELLQDIQVRTQWP